MDAVLAHLNVAQLGWFLFAITALTVLRAVITGKLVPGSERDLWRETALSLMRQHETVTMPAAETQVDVLQALAEVIRRRPSPVPPPMRGEP